MYLSYFVRIVLNLFQRHFETPHIWERLSAASIAIFVAAITGLACWNIWKEKRTARGWAIAGSLIYFLIFAGQFFQSIFPSRSRFFYHADALIIALVGLTVAFSWHKPWRHKTFFEWLYERDQIRAPKI
jgi:hypothetical protein